MKTYAIGIIFGFICLWLVRGVINGYRSNKRNRLRGWRVMPNGRDERSYEELRNGKWEKINISGERLSGKPSFVIYLNSPEKWKEYPEWARDRRDEIISRIKSELKEPEYEYLGEFYRYKWEKDTNFNGIRIYVGQPPVEYPYKRLGFISEEGNERKYKKLIVSLITNTTVKARNMGANAIINWHMKGNGLNSIKAKGEAVIFEKYPA